MIRLPGRSDPDANDEGTAGPDPDGTRLGDPHPSGSRRHTRVRGARLDAGPRLSACPQARLGHRASGSADRRVSGGGCRRDPRRPGLDRRHLPGLPAGLSTGRAIGHTSVVFRLECSSLESPSGRSDTGSGSLAIVNPRRTIMAIQIVMDRTGDSRHPFNPDDAQELVKAEQRFYELTKAGFTAAVRTGPDQTSQIRSFDPTAEET